MSRTLKNISTYRRASPSFPRRFPRARHREGIFREGKELRGFRSSCCIADKVFPDGARSYDPTYRQPGWVTSDLCRSRRGGNSVEIQHRIETPLWLRARALIRAFVMYQSSISPPPALSLIPTTIFVSLMYNEEVSFVKFQIKEYYNICLMLW